MSDRLALARAIEDAGIEQDKAERIASAIHGNVATKADVQIVQGNVLATRADMTTMQTDVTGVRADMTAMRADVTGVRAGIAALHAEFDLVARRLLTRLGVLVVLAGALFAVLHYWPRTHG